MEALGDALPWGVRTALVVLATLAAFAYSVVNVVGAWVVVRRRSGVASLFLLAAAVLTVGGVATAYRMVEGAWIITAGVLLASAASYANARVILRRVTPRHHLLRLAIGAALAWIAFTSVG